jgi:hypothetical protein
VGADTGENRSDDPCGGVEDAELCADINVDGAGREASGGNAINGIRASVRDVKVAIGGIRKNRVVGLLRMGSKSIRTRRLDRNDDAAR